MIDLAKLRELCGREVPNDSPDFEQQIGPGHWRKVYRPKQKYFMLRANCFQFRDERLWQARSSREIAKCVDNRPLPQLRDEVDAAMKQVMIRAATGNEEAIRLLYWHLKFSIKTLEAIEKGEWLKRVRTIAETCPDWPVLLSLNPQVVKHEKERLRILHVGTKAPTPRKSGQRINPRSYWTDLAATAFKACQDIKILLPELKKHCRGVKRQRRLHKLWGRSIKVSIYNLPPDVIVIADWEEQCARLSLPVTSNNFEPWWNAVQRHVLEYWNNAPDEYNEALRQIGQKESQKEYARRNMAEDRIKRAFRSVARVQSQDP